MDREELTNRFKYHPPPNEDVARLHQQVRSVFQSDAYWLNEVLPEGREKSLAITKIEEAMMWANAAIARNPVPEPGSNV